MGSLTSLNSYSSDDITYDIPDYNLIVNEAINGTQPTFSGLFIG